MNGKFTVESDFVDSFLNASIISKYFNRKENAGLIQDALVYNSCVNMNADILQLADCTDRRDRVSAFIEKHSNIAGYKETASTKCSAELLDAHILDHTINRYVSSTSPYNILLTKLKANEKMQVFQKCMDDNI